MLINTVIATHGDGSAGIWEETMYRCFEALTRYRVPSTVHPRPAYPFTYHTTHHPGLFLNPAEPFRWAVNRVFINRGWECVAIGGW